MKALKCLRRNSALRIDQASIHFGHGAIKIGDWTGSVVWGTDENGWEHVSVAPYLKSTVPLWDEV